ncbi:MAG TPA: sulfate ABC transporter substrate-binding protein [Solirubrobacteraceae bacterium]|nr:sulfate ABC transporter substrate-binding protein [Solirubrobacteraceae bacterium]
MTRVRNFRRGWLAAVIAVPAALALAGCGGSSDSTTNAAATASPSSSGGGSSTQLALVAYSTPKKAYDALTSAFGQTTTGKGISFGESFGASGAQSRAVASGQPADVVAFSTTPDVTRLVKAGMVAKSWNANPANGIVSDSVVVLVVRKGNPKHITGWDDLVKPGVDVITPNPSTSGSARWNILAAYGAQLKEGKTAAQALAYVKTLLTKNVSVQPSSASAALQTFTGGKGDVLIDYESDAIAAVKAGDAVQYIVPNQTILIETPIAVTSNSSHSAQARAFVNWLWSPAAQTIWAQKGYRPVLASVAKQFASKFPTPPQLFTIKTLGGWTKVDKTFFGASSGLITKIEQAAGVPTVSS